MKCLVIGAGTMGAGIAEVLARAGFTTQLQDQSEELVQQGQARILKSLAKAKIDPAQVLSHLQQIDTPDLIVEAIVEDLQLKKQLLVPLSHQFPQAIIASNTRSLSITEMAAACHRPERVIGLHFFNPAPIMELLEIVLAEQTSPETLEQAQQLASQIKKTAIVVKDVPGFASSRLGIILGMEAIRMLESGVASVQDIDKAMELGYRHPMGPLKLTDLVGLDVRLAIAEHLTKEIGPQFTPPPLLRRLVRAGRLGKKTGQGFYSW